MKRPSFRERGYSSQWDKYRTEYLAEHPHCVRCLEAGWERPSNVVDHIKPHNGDMKVFWAKENHRALCRSCHSIRTNAETGGFGNRAGRKAWKPRVGKGCSVDGNPTASEHHWNKR